MEQPINELADEPNRKRRWLVIYIVTALVVAGVGVGFALHRRGGGHSDQATGAPDISLPATEYQFKVGHLPGYTTRYAGTATGVQGALISVHGEDKAAVDVGTSLESMGAHPRPADAADVMIHGQSGYFGTYGSPLDHGFKFVVIDNTAPTAATQELVWPDTSGLWVAIQSYGLTEDQVIAVANAVQVGHRAPVKVVARFSHLPPDLQVSAISVDETQGWTDIGFGPSSGQLQLTVAPASALIPGVATPGPQTEITIAGYSGDYSATDSETILTKGKLGVRIEYQTGTAPINPEIRAIPMDELTKLIKGMTVASDPNNQTTWFDAADALPH